MDKNLWNKVKNVGILVAIIVAMTQLWEWMSDPSDKLELELNYCNLKIPPFINNEIERLDELLEPKNISKAFDLENIRGDSPTESEIELTDRLLREVSFWFRGQMTKLRKMPLYFLDGYWFANLANNGSTTLRSVVFTLPGTKYVSIKREGSKALFGDSNGVIQIGEMRPGEEVLVRGWTSFISSSDLQDARVNHDRGLGKMTTFVAVGPIGQLAEEYLPLLGWILLICLPFIAFMIISQYFENRSGGKGSAKDPPKKATKETQ